MAKKFETLRAHAQDRGRFFSALLPCSRRNLSFFVTFKAKPSNLGEFKAGEAKSQELQSHQMAEMITFFVAGCGFVTIILLGTMLVEGFFFWGVVFDFFWGSIE